MKLSFVSATAAILAFSLTVPAEWDSVQAHHKRGEKHHDTAATIAGVVALGVLGAALASHQHRRGEDEYTPHPRFHPDENAVGRCMHRAEREVQRAGGHYVQLDDVQDVNYKNNGKTVVQMRVTGFYSFANKTSSVRCVVNRGRVTRFEY